MEVKWLFPGLDPRRRSPAHDKGSMMKGVGGLAHHLTQPPTWPVNTLSGRSLSTHSDLRPWTCTPGFTSRPPHPRPGGLGLLRRQDGTYIGRKSCKAPQ